MRVLIYTRSDAMGWVRCMWPAVVLRAQGHDVTVWDAQRLDNPIMFTPNGRGGAKNVSSLPGVDVVVLQRVTQQTVYDAMRIWQANGIRVVIDMDDNLRDVHPSQNPGAWSTLNQTGDHLSWKIAEKACADADAVVVSTEDLLRVYGGTVVRNCVPGAYLGIGVRTAYPDRIIGWSGAASFRMRDGAVMGSALARLQRDGHELHVIGSADRIGEVFTLDRPPAHAATVPLDQYPYAMAQVTVGVVPLANNRFNRAKSWLKPLQFAALGVPVVCSPSYEYEELAGHIPSIVFARNPRQWYARTREILMDDDLRASLSFAGRFSAEQFLYERNAHLWWNAWTGDSMADAAPQMAHHTL